jgi:hypothetical protein
MGHGTGNVLLLAGPNAIGAGRAQQLPPPVALAIESLRFGMNQQDDHHQTKQRAERDER